MSRTLRLVTITAVAIMAVVLVPAAATACRITNASLWGDYSTEMYFWFDCGHGCGSYYKVEPGKYVNTSDGSGQSGNVQACTPGSADRLVEGGPGDGTTFLENGTVHVDASGEARFKLNNKPATGPGVYDITPYHAVVHWDVYDADNDLTKSVIHTLDLISSMSSVPYCWLGTA